MATTYPLATLGPTITSAGISAPAYADIYASLQASFKSIYGTDAYIDPDSQDGQLLGIVAKAIADVNAGAIALYNSYSPAVAQGNALSSSVKINGLRRLVATNSTALLRVTGQVGTTITNGAAQDSAGNLWSLPASVTIPSAGYIDVTATCQTAGAVAALAGTITKIATPTLGWQSVNNSSDAALGQPVETDAALRQRQATSTALPSKTVLAGMIGAIYSLAGVTQVKGYENDTNATDANGLPPHSISMVVLGGASSDIATAIFNKKTPGTYTYGSTSVPVTDSAGIINTIRYFIPTAVPIQVAITVKALSGYTTAVGAAIQASIAAYINALGIGTPVMVPRLYLPAQLYGGQNSGTFEVQVLQICVKPGTPGSADVTTAFNQIATCSVSDIALTVV